MRWLDLGTVYHLPTIAMIHNTMRIELTYDLDVLYGPGHRKALLMLNSRRTAPHNTPHSTHKRTRHP